MSDTIWFIIGWIGIILVVWFFIYVITTHKPQKEMSDKEIDKAMEQYGRDLGYEDEKPPDSYYYDEIDAIDDEFIQYKTPDLIFNKKLNKYVDYKEITDEDSKID